MVVLDFFNLILGAITGGGGLMLILMVSWTLTGLSVAMVALISL